MEGEQSLSSSVKKLEKYIYNISTVRARNTLSKSQLEAVIALTSNITAGRKLIDQYQTEDDTAERLQTLQLALERLVAVREDILTASQLDLLDTIEVSHLSALTEQIIDRIA